MKTYVIGNESSDADSIVSSFILSKYIRAIPIINDTREQFETKKDVQELIKLINFSDLYTFIDDVQIDEDDKIILVDHNELSEKEKTKFKNNRITLIIDHHRDTYTINTKKIINTNVKSCCSLVLNYIRGHYSLNDYDKNILSIVIMMDSRGEPSREEKGLVNINDMTYLKYLNLKFESIQSLDSDFKLIEKIPYSSIKIKSKDISWVDIVLERMKERSYENYILIQETLLENNYLFTFNIKLLGLDLIQTIDSSSIKIYIYKINTMGRKRISFLVNS